MEINRTSAYEFDTILDGIPVFTDKNIDFITAIVNNDSNYRNSFNTEYKHSSAGFLKDRFPKREKGELLKAIVLIDKENSTHLSVTGKSRGSGEGRKRAFEYIADHYDRVRTAIESGDPDIVEELGKNLVPERYNISFASKFCTFTNRHCFNKDDFSIVDTVLCRVLPAYEAIYLHTEIDRSKWVRQKETHVFDYRSYQDTIGAILSRVNGSGDVSRSVTREEFDLLLWYYYKGSDDRIAELYKTLNR